MAKETELATTSASASARPDFVKVRGTAGREDLRREDIQLPRLLLAQALSPEIQETEANYIPNLKSGMLFNDLTKEIYGKETLRFWVIRQDVPRWMEFYPIGTGGGVKDFNVPEGDPRTEPDENGEVKATQFWDFVLMLLHKDHIEPIALALKGKSGSRAAKTLNGLITIRNADAFAGNYTVTPAMAKTPKGTFAVYKFLPDGWVSSLEEFGERRKIFEDFKDKTLNIAREPGDETDFPTDAPAGDM